MEISPELRREAKAIQRAHDESIGGLRELVKRLMDPATNADDAHKHQLVLTGVNRRHFLRIGGVSVLTAAVLAACGDDDNNGTVAKPPAEPESNPTDITILRTASSLEHLAVDIYDKAIASGLVTDAAVAEAAKLFRGQHAEHAALFEGATKEAGGQPFTTANPAVMASLAGRIAGLGSQLDVVTLARDLEGVASATYQASAGSFADQKLNTTVMSVGGVEARHLALLNNVLRQNPNPVAFQTTVGAVAAGTGI